MLGEISGEHLVGKKFHARRMSGRLELPESLLLEHQRVTSIPLCLAPEEAMQGRVQFGIADLAIRGRAHLHSQAECSFPKLCPVVQLIVGPTFKVNADASGTAGPVRSRVDDPGWWIKHRWSCRRCE